MNEGEGEREWLREREWERGDQSIKGSKVN